MILTTILEWVNQGSSPSSAIAVAFLAEMVISLIILDVFRIVICFSRQKTTAYKDSIFC